MGMKLWIDGTQTTPIEFSAVDAKTATTTISRGDAGLPEGNFGGQVTVEQDRSSTKNGVTRVLVKTSIKTPIASADGNTITGVQPITAHVVLTVPRSVAERMILEESGATSDAYTSTVCAWLSALIVPLFTGKSLVSVPDYTTPPLVRAITSGLPLNMDSGTYGDPVV